jgi:glycosyltransferase involved in cell wall biosynthesis
MPKYSIILPVRNGGHYVKECVKSVLAQTCQDYNFIVLDNNSTDGTSEWIASLNDLRIIIYSSAVSLTIQDNWARIAYVEKNEFITIIGHDDILYPNYLSVMDSLINNFPDAKLYQAHFNFIDGKGDIIRPCKPMQEMISSVDFFKAVLRNTIEIMGTGFMMRSKDYNKNGGIPSYPNLLFADIEIWMKIIRDSYIAISPVSCFAFRTHLDNTSKSTGQFRLIAFERMILFFKEFVQQNPVMKSPLNQYGQAFFKNYAEGACHKLIYVPKQSRNNITMDNIIFSAEKSAQLLMPGINFKPATFLSIRLAKIIDSNYIFRWLFLLLKRLSKRTY